MESRVTNCISTDSCFQCKQSYASEMVMNAAVRQRDSNSRGRAKQSENSLVLNATRQSLSSSSPTPDKHLLGQCTFQNVRRRAGYTASVSPLMPKPPKPLANGARYCIARWCFLSKAGWVFFISYYSTATKSFEISLHTQS